jgi:hypothetical protein
VTELRSVPNPYDFANPVAEQELFIGRNDELSEIKYYLEHASKARHPINIAILGGRAAGKTSLLNITEQEAVKFGLLPVRIDLNEDDAASQMAFFFKIFDAIFTTACSNGAYGGKTAKTFDAYLDVTCSLAVPEDKTFCPFIFPIQYAKALGSGNPTQPVADHSFRHDLLDIQTEVGRPIAILFDEGNVLSKSRVLLQKLRNIFMNTTGYMLIMTGTSEMFPLMDEVFSPIIRQFKKIPLGQFKEIRETRRLIRRYLEISGLEPESLFDFDDNSDLSDIHNLTSGRPYEIQLVCHTLFRRVQQKRTDKMRLDIGAIEEVRQQLESSQNLVSRPVLQKIRSLDRENLRALGSFAPCTGHATFEQIWAVMHVFGTEGIERSYLYERFLEFKAEGILDESDGGIVEFKGDDFDKIYAKYLALEKKAAVQFGDLELGFYIRAKLLARIAPVTGLRPVVPFNPSRRQIDVTKIVGALAVAPEGKSVFVETPLGLILEVYELLFDYQGVPQMRIMELSLNLAGNEIQSWAVPEVTATPDLLDDFSRELGAQMARAADVGGGARVQILEVPVPSIGTMLKSITDTSNQKLRARVAGNHAEAVADDYMSNQVEESTRRHADCAFHLRADLAPTSVNNLGYFYVAQADFAKARTLFEGAYATREQDEMRALLTYNYGIMEAMSGSFEAAKEKLTRAVESSHLYRDKLACLFVPIIEGDKLRFVEARESVELGESARNALEVLTGFEPKK